MGLGAGARDATTHVLAPRQMRSEAVVRPGTAEADARDSRETRSIRTPAGGVSRDSGRL